MSTMNTDTAKKNFLLPISITENGTVTKTLNTTDTYVDKDIQITITTPDATYKNSEQSVTATASTNDTTYTTSTNTGYAITLLADAQSDDVTVGVDQAGFAAKTDEVTVAGATATQASKTVYIKAGELQGSGDVTVTGKGGVELGKKTTTAPTSGFYIEADSTGSVGVKTAGWVDPTKNANVSTASTAYYPVTAVTLNNEAASGATYTTVNTPILKSGSGLFINEGYIENTYISLADLVPDDATVVANDGEKSNLMYKTVSAYDKDGKLIAGSMDDVTKDNIKVTDGANTNATISTVTVTAGTDNFKVSGSKATAGTVSVNIDKTGYIEKDAGVANVSVSGTATVDATLNVIAIDATADNSNVTVTPVISKGTSTAKSADITTTVPTDKKYVVVNTAAIAANSTVTPGVATEGYGTSAKHTATATTVTAGAAASGNYYVAIDNGAVALDGSISGTSVTGMTNDMAVAKTANVASMAGVLDAAPTTGDYITISAATEAQSITVSGSVSSTVTEGYVTKDNEGKKDVTATVGVNATSNAKYIKVYDGSFTE